MLGEGKAGFGELVGFIYFFKFSSFLNNKREKKTQSVLVELRNILLFVHTIVHILITESKHFVKSDHSLGAKWESFGQNC